MASSAASPALVTHRGACHCRDVEFEFDGERDLVAIDCNCSICAMKKNTHAIIPQARFRLLKGEDALTTYTFNTHRAKHMFCKRCGVQPFYVPRSNQDGYAITVACIDPGTLGAVTVEPFDGQNWEQTFAQSDISKYSKE
ncbi:Proline-rich protein 6, partial [Globisporangium splendens]